MSTAPRSSFARGAISWVGLGAIVGWLLARSRTGPLADLDDADGAVAGASVGAGIVVLILATEVAL